MLPGVSPLSSHPLHRNYAAVLDWDESEIIAAFEAAPAVEDDATLYVFSAAQDGATVELTVAPFHNEVSVSIRFGEAGPPVYWSGLLRCDALVRRREAGGAEVVVARRGDETVLTIQVRPRLTVSGAPVAV